MQEQAQQLAPAPGPVTEPAPAPEQVRGTAQALVVALELVPTQKLVPPPVWMPVLVLGMDLTQKLVLALALALALALVPNPGWMPEAMLELAQAGKLVSETALELGTGLQEKRCPTWVPCPEHFQGQSITACQRDRHLSPQQDVDPGHSIPPAGPRCILAPGPVPALESLCGGN